MRKAEVFLFERLLKVVNYCKIVSFYDIKRA